MASICRSIQSELVLIYCDVDINEVNIYCCIHTLLLASRRYVYNFRFLFVSRLEPLLFFINSITFQFVWRDVDVFFFFFFFSVFFHFFFQFSILKLKYVYYTCFIVLKHTHTAIHREATTSSRRESAEAAAASARGLC